MKHDYYEKTLYRHAINTRQIDSEKFIPIYNDSIDREFKVIQWPTYAETFGAPSRNRT